MSVLQTEDTVKVWALRLKRLLLQSHIGLPGGSVVIRQSAKTGDSGPVGSVPGSERSPAGGHENPPQYSCLENPHGKKSLVGWSPGWLQRVRHGWAPTYTDLRVSWICGVISLSPSSQQIGFDYVPGTVLGATENTYGSYRAPALH